MQNKDGYGCKHKDENNKFRWVNKVIVNKVEIRPLSLPGIEGRRS